MNILLADLAYDRTSPSLLAVPMGIGCVASYTQEHSGLDMEIQIVRTIEEFEQAIGQQDFHIVGFSFYIWNARLSGLMATKAKLKNPNCVTVFGGPNLPINQEQKEECIRRYSQVDFFVEKEGEIAFCKLTTALFENDYSIDVVKRACLPNIRSVLGDEFLSSPMELRIRDLDVIPSIYLAGYMDKFMEAGFTPMIENNRGCPFSCDYCGEGDGYHSKVAKHSKEYLNKEYAYVAKKMITLSHLPFSEHLYFSDSNTGMYREDIDLARYLHQMQEQYGYPKVIITSTGKNVKERISEVIDTLDGALTMTASVQSTNEEVLKNIHRENVSLDTLMSVATRGGKQMNTYSEIILGLPGDSYKRHLQSVKDMMDCRIQQLSNVQLSILPDTPMASPEYIERHNLDVRYRLLVKGAALIELDGEKLTAVETEPVCVGGELMSFEDYLRSRVADLLVSIFYNNLFSEETFRWLTESGRTPFEYLQALIDMKKPPAFIELLDDFHNDLRAELYDDPSEIEALLASGEIYEKIISGEMGANLTAIYMKRAFSDMDVIKAMALDAAEIAYGQAFREYVAQDIVNSDKFKAASGDVDRRVYSMAKEKSTSEPRPSPRNNADLAEL